jgi:hypothetical protein
MNNDDTSIPDINIMTEQHHQGFRFSKALTQILTQIGPIKISQLGRRGEDFEMTYLTLNLILGTISSVLLFRTFFTALMHHIGTVILSLTLVPGTQVGHFY